MRAALLFRPNRHYRAQEFGEGLIRHGFSITTRPDHRPAPSDLLVLWNRSRAYTRVAETYERAGARIIIAENGFLDRFQGHKYYALALGHHNGVGSWYAEGAPRFQIEQEPTTRRGDAVLVLPQRGIGEKGVAMPLDWPKRIRDRLARLTRRPLIIRRHPGNHPLSRVTPLEDDLARSHCVVTWASGAAIKAIRAGVPCFHELDGWIANCASTRLADQLEKCDAPDTGELWRRVSWASWTMHEIQSGEAFDRLLHADSGSLFCAGKPSLQDDRGRHGPRHPKVRR